MEIAKITANGQITIPITIRRKLNLKDGGKIAFIEIDGDYKIVNPIKLVILETQNAFVKLADELGLKNEDDVINLCKEVRKVISEENNADNG